MAAGGWEWGCVRIEISGKVTVITGAMPHGQGQETSFAQIAADWLGVPIEDIRKNLPPGLEPGLEASSFFEPSNCTFPFGTHIVAVELDRDTGQVNILKYVAVDDCGKQVNPLLVEGQVQGGITQSLCTALMERTVYDESGQLLTGEFMDYAIPRAPDIPDYVLGSTETPSPSNPLGVKGGGAQHPCPLRQTLERLPPLMDAKKEKTRKESSPIKVWVTPAEKTAIAAKADAHIKPSGFAAQC